MSCTCEACREHARTLGLARWPASKKAVHRAYRSAAKLWHPDRFANDETKIHEAEERFKLLQVAYSELTVHNRDESAEEVSEESGVSEQHAPEVEPKPNPMPRHIPFASAPGCYSLSQFPPQAQAAVARHLGLYDYAVAIADLSGDGSFERFFLLASHGVIVKEASGSISLLLYEDLGRIEIENRESAGKIGFLGKIVEELTGARQRFSLEIFRRRGVLFCSLTGQLEDAAKIAIYQYLTRKKLQYKA
jgi:curved DNA-binding protein CbpA